MRSLYSELADKVASNPSVTKPGMPRFDMTLLLFNAREQTNELWLAASEEIERSRKLGVEPSPRLAAAVEALAPIFGER